MTFQFGTNSSANETLHKTVSLGSDISCIVKDPIDILSPYLIVKDTEVKLTDNYAKCSDTNRYYFIIVEDLPGGRRGIQCTVDPSRLCHLRKQSRPERQIRSMTHSRELPVHGYHCSGKFWAI